MLKVIIYNLRIEHLVNVGMPVLIMECDCGNRCQLREECWVRKKELLRVQIKVLCHRILNFVLDAAISFKVLLTEHTGMCFVKVDEVVPMGQGPAVQVQDTRPSVTAALGQTLLGKVEEFVSLRDCHQIISDEATTPGRQTHGVQIIDLLLVIWMTHKRGVSLL